MDVIVARCHDCGYHHDREFAPCPACGRAEPSGWWCDACGSWCAHRVCPACMGLLVAPVEWVLGAAPAGTTVPVRFTVRNAGKRPLDVPLSADAGVILAARRLAVRAGAEAAVKCDLRLGGLAAGRHTFAVRFHTAVPVETRLVVDVVPAVARLEFRPVEVVVHVPTPGKIASCEVNLRNTGNLPVTAALVGSEPWLTVQPTAVAITTGRGVSLKVSVKTRKADTGSRDALLLATHDAGTVWQAAVRVVLPEPKLEAASVEFGTVLAGRPVVKRLTVRNAGDGHAACTVAGDQDWLAVVPGSVTVAPGLEKVVKVRAHFTRQAAGARTGHVVFAAGGKELLRVPVSAACRVPKPLLGAVRRQTLGCVANDAPAARGFRVANPGDGQLDCTVTVDQPWVEVLTGTLAVPPGKRRRVEYQLNTPAMATGAHRATIHIRSNGGNADVPVSVTVVDPHPVMEVLSEPDLDSVAPGQPAAGFIAVRNTGVGLLALRALPEDTRVTASPTEMKLAPGLPARIGVTVAAGGLPGGTHAFGILLASNAGSQRAAVRVRLPVEELDAPAAIDLGDRPAGRPTGCVLRVRNPAAEPIALKVRAEHDWVRPGNEQVTVPAGEWVAVPFRIDLQPGVLGAVTSTIRLEGRALRHAVAVRVTARRVELAVHPRVVELGRMTPGEERAVTFQVVNSGELVAEVQEQHVRGDLEVWVRPQSVPPGTTGSVVGRVRLNGTTGGQQLRAVVALPEELAVVVVATVVRSNSPRLVAGVIGGVGVVVSGALAATVGWVFGAAVAVCALVAAGVIRTRTHSP